MAGHKKQHIIPQHYLKGFSKERDNSEISTRDKIIYFHNIKNEKRHCTAIKNIGYGNYFYGKDEFYEVNNLDNEDNLDCKNLEETLNRFETIHNDLLNQIITYKNLSLSLEQIYALYSFLTLLKTRTKSARDYALKSAKNLGENLCQMILDKNSLHDFRAKVTPHLIGTHVGLMQTVVGSLDEKLPLMTDLSPVLLINDTETNFITSDNPVIFYNYIAPNYSKYKITTALACSGFMMFCPITEKLLILLYDGDLYQVHRHTRTTIRVKKKSDIDSMNTLQVVSCSEEIYCYDENEIDYIKNLYSKVERYMKESQAVFTKLNKKYKNPYAIGDEIIATQFIDNYYKIRLSFLKFDEESMKIYKKIDNYKTKNNIPYAVFRHELRREFNMKII